MPADPVLAVLGLLFCWLLLRIVYRRTGEEELQEGRSRVRGARIPGVQTIERLPDRPLAFAATVTVEGSSPGSSFEVDLGELRCTCPDFRRKREELPSDAIGRVCEHVSEALRETGATGSFDPLLRAIVESGETKETYFQVDLGGGREAAIGHTPRSGLLDVVAEARPKDRRSGGEASRYRAYRYSLDDDDWVDGQRPPGSGKIREVIGKLPLEG